MNGPGVVTRARIEELCQFGSPGTGSSRQFDGLPADATIDDVIERLVFLAKVEEGLEQLDKGQGVPHDEIKRRLQL